jgi:tetratricopeptide (TPR) repeat protein
MTIKMEKMRIGTVLIFSLCVSSALADQKSSIDSAKKELDAGSFGKVLKILQSSNDVASLLLKARAQLCMESEEEAMSSIQSARRLDGKNLEAAILSWYYLARWKSNVPKALISLQALLQAHPRNAEIHSLLGRAWHLSGRTTDGMQEMQIGSKMDPQSMLCSVNLADSYLDELDDRSALSILNQACSFHPQSPEPLLRRAQLHEFLGQANLALADYSKAIEISPACPIAYYYRASFLAHQGHFKKALDDCTKAKDSDETHLIAAKILRLRIKCDRQEGLLQDAVADGTSLVKDVPKRKTIDGASQADLLALAQDLQAIKQYRRALQTIEVLQRFNAYGTSAAFTKANLYLALGDYNSSLTEINSLLARDTPLPEWYNCRAAVLKKLGRNDAALADLKKAKELKTAP